MTEGRWVPPMAGREKTRENVKSERCFFFLFLVFLLLD